MATQTNVKTGLGYWSPETERYITSLERALRAVVDMRYHLENMPCRNNGGALVRWKQRAEEIVAEGMDKGDAP